MPEPLLSDQQQRQQLARLNGAHDRWHIVDGRLQRAYRFDSFVQAIGFMLQSAIEAEKLNHHPDWSNCYKTVSIELTTHDAGGLTRLDFELAAKMEKLAAGAN